MAKKKTPKKRSKKAAAKSPTLTFQSDQVRQLYEELEVYLRENHGGYWEAHETLPVFRIWRGRNSLNVQPGESDYARVGTKLTIALCDPPNTPELNLWLLQMNASVIGATFEVSSEEFVVLSYSIVQPPYNSKLDAASISRAVEYMDGIAWLWRKDIIAEFGGEPLPGPMPKPRPRTLAWDAEIRFILLNDGDYYARVAPGEILYDAVETSQDGSPWIDLYDENENYVAMLGYSSGGRSEIVVRKPEVFAAGSPLCTLWDRNQEPRAIVIPRGCKPPFEATDRYGRVVFSET